MSAYELSINLYILQLTQYCSSLQVLLQKSSAAACLREAVGVQVRPHRHRLEVRTAHIPAVLRKSLETTLFAHPLRSETVSGYLSGFVAVNPTSIYPSLSIVL